MLYHQEIHCPCCDSNNIIKSGANAKGIDCETQTFMLDCYKACEPGITEKIVEMAINGSGIRDTARILKINKNTVINMLKKGKPSCSSKP